MGPIPLTHCKFFFFWVPKLTEPSKIKKKKNPGHEDRTGERRQKKKKKEREREREKKPRIDRSERKKKKKKKKKNRTANQEKKGKKKVKSGQKLVLVLFVGPLCVFNYNIVIEL